MVSLLLSPESRYTQGFVCALQDSVSPVLCKFHNQFPVSTKDKFSGGFSVPLADRQAGNLLWVLELSQWYRYNCSAVCGSSAQWLYCGVNGYLLQEGLCHRLHDSGSCTQSSCLCSRPLLTYTSSGDSNTGLAQSLCGLLVLWNTRFCLGPLTTSGGYGV